MPHGAAFDREVLTRLIARGRLRHDMRILVVCGGTLDFETLRDLGFAQVTLSNLDPRADGDRFAPYTWSFQDAESLTFPDGSFDLAVVHDGLHHCRSPHRGLLEMYRVAREAILVFESRDSLAMRLACRLGLADRHEVHAVVNNGFEFGGVGNSAIPNYVYRWTEREVRKTIESYAPYGAHRIQFFYGLDVPTERLQRHRQRGIRFIGAVIGCVVPPLSSLLGRDGNRFAFLVDKPGMRDLYPWIQPGQGGFTVDREWCRARFADPRERQPGFVG
jgi:SAM-dependent methyltransferase